MALISKMGAKYNRSMPNEPNVILIIATYVTFRDTPRPTNPSDHAVALTTTRVKRIRADAGAAKSEKVVMAKEWGVPIVTKVHRHMPHAPNSRENTHGGLKATVCWWRSIGVALRLRA